MSQVIIFFGYLIIGVAGTLVVFGHVSIIFVYGWDTLQENLFPSDPDSYSSLILSSLSFIPGALMLGFGKFMKKLESAGGEPDPLDTDSGHDPEKAVLVQNTPLKPSGAPDRD